MERTTHTNATESVMSGFAFLGLSLVYLAVAAVGFPTLGLTAAAACLVASVVIE
jgi:hypothetical protein